MLLHQLQQLLDLLLAVPLLTVLDALQGTGSAGEGIQQGKGQQQGVDQHKESQREGVGQCRYLVSRGRAAHSHHLPPPAAGTTAGAAAGSQPAGAHQEDFHHRGRAVVDQLHNLPLGEAKGLRAGQREGRRARAAGSAWKALGESGGGRRHAPPARCLRRARAAPGPGPRHAACSSRSVSALPRVV